MIQKIKGGAAEDSRGLIRFVNDFDMSAVKRFYIIKNNDLELIRGWRGHLLEQRWFYVLSGAFKVYLIKIDHWSNPSENLEIREETIRASDFYVLNVPAGYATAFKAIENDSQLLVFADYGIDHAPMDDYTWPLKYFKNL